MKKQILLLFAIGFILFHGCVKEDYFGLSPYGNIKTIEHADYKHLNILWLFQKFTVIVYGE